MCLELVIILREVSAFALRLQVKEYRLAFMEEKKTLSLEKE